MNLTPDIDYFSIRIDHVSNLLCIVQDNMYSITLYTPLYNHVTKYSLYLQLQTNFKKLDRMVT